MFLNTSITNVLARQQFSQEVENEKSQFNFGSSPETKFEVINKPEVRLDSLSKIEESITFIASNYKKSIEEIIEENKKITESKDEVYQPLNFDRDLEDMIRLDNQIIDSNLTDEFYPLDFEIINNISSELKKQIFKNDDFKKNLFRS